MTGFATKKDPGNFDLASVGMGTDGDVNLDTKPAATKVVKIKGETIKTLSLWIHWTRWYATDALDMPSSAQNWNLLVAMTHIRQSTTQ